MLRSHLRCAKLLSPRSTEVRVLLNSLRHTLLNRLHLPPALISPSQKQRLKSPFRSCTMAGLVPSWATLPSYCAMPSWFPQMQTQPQSTSCCLVYRCSSTRHSAWAQLKTSLVTPIFKKGDATDTANYRPIAVGEPLSRLYASILVQRLVQYTEQHGLRSPTHAGYRPEHSTIHQTFVLQHVIDKHRRLKSPLYLCFVDLNLHMTGCSGSCYGTSFAGWGYKAPCWAPYSLCMMGAYSP